MKLRLLTLALLIFTIFAGVTSYILNEQIDHRQPTINAGKWVEPARDLPPFSLKRNEQDAFTNESLKGKWTVLAFGFTHCPDICPATMAFFRDELKLLSEEQALLQFVMVSVDPERDTPTLLRDYANNFDSRIITVTGSNDQLKDLAKALGAAFAKEDFQAGETNQYSVAHSPYVYLINPEGKWQGLYNPPVGRGKLAVDLTRLVNIQ